MDPTSLESLVLRRGIELFSRIHAARPIVLTPSWWDERLMRFGMDDEALKVQLFRFVDVLPMLRGHRAVTRHLREYFDEARDRMSALVRLGGRWMPQTGLSGRLLASIARAGAERLARRFIAGTNPKEALRVISELRRLGVAFTIDLLGEAVLTDPEAEHYQERYLELLRELPAAVHDWPAVELADVGPTGPLPRVNISIKLSSLYSQFDPIDPATTAEAVKARLRPILESARQRGVFINIDMEQHAYKDVTLRIFREILSEPAFRDWPDVGIAIQAYLRCCLDDLAALDRFAAERGTPIWIRLVKGAYWDYETAIAAQNGWPRPVFDEKWESDANFEECVRFILEHGRTLRLAVGSHNVRSIAYAMALAEQMDLPPRTVEYQVLYGMADPIRAGLHAMEQRVRVYTPYGQLLPGMAYLVRRLLENTANESFLRASFADNVPKEQLLMNPVDAGRARGRRSADVRAAPPRRSFTNEPPSDFSRPAVQEAMRAALRDVEAQFGQTVPLVIGGREIATPATIDSVNPSHRRQIVGRSARATIDHAKQAVEAATAAFSSWRDTPVQRRVELLFATADVLRRQRFELAAWEVYECAKQWREADADVVEAIDFLDYYAHEMLRLSTPQVRDLPGEENEYFYEPRGVVVVIAPWNFPLAILCGMTAAAIVAGNTAIMKPAEQSPIIAAKLMAAFREAGVPDGVVGYLPGVGEEIGPYLVEHRDVAMVAFTGSRPVGLDINRRASLTPGGHDHVKRVVMEMGGKNAVLVDEDADLDEAIHGVVASAFGYQGQKCSACSRAIVLDGLYDAFLARLVEATRSLKVGPADDPSCTVGPVIDDEARRRILDFIAKGRQEARLAFGADVGPLADEGYYVGPHVFADVDPHATIAQEEIFGPVLAVIRARDLSHAIEIANSTSYALTGGLYSRSPAAIQRVRRELRVGNLYINRKITGAIVDRQPFGGFKLSGIGSKAGGPDYLLQFVLPRTITENTMRHGFAPSSRDAAAPSGHGHETPAGRDRTNTLSP